MSPLVVALTEHDRADLARADACMAIEFDNDRLTGKLLGRNMWHEAPSIEIDRVATRRLQDGYSGSDQLLTKILYRAQAVGKIGFVDHFLQPLRDGLQVTTSESSVSCEAFGYDENVT